MTDGIDGRGGARPAGRVPGGDDREPRRGERRGDSGWAPPSGPRDPYRSATRGDERPPPARGTEPGRDTSADPGRRGDGPAPTRRRRPEKDRPENGTEQGTDRVPAVRRRHQAGSDDEPVAPRGGGHRRRDPAATPRRAAAPPPADAVAETVRARSVRPRRTAEETARLAAASVDARRADPRADRADARADTRDPADPYDTYDAPVRSARSRDTAAAAPAAAAGGGTHPAAVADDDRVGPRRTAGTSARSARREAVTRKRRRIGVLVLAVVVLLGVVGGGAYVVGSSFFDKDYDGTGTGDVIVQVVSGDSTSQIGQMLLRRGVVASVGAFTGAASDDSRVLAVQPGYYQMSGQMSAESAVARLVDPVARVGRLEVRGGTQLDDTRSPDGTTAPGVLSLISQASCGRIDGARRCVSVDDLRTTMEKTDPAELGAPTWALEDIRKAEPARRFEGLVSPGIYDIAPGTAAPDVWRELLAASVPRLEAAGIGDASARAGVTPYQALIISSLVEKEGITPDMPRVSRVVHNRLAAGQRLELDSTVNYPLDVQALRTTADARARIGPYNSYAVAGLPPTPIAAAGKAAMAAALAPEPGPWLFFVRCKPDGTSCFGTTLAEHQANIRQAIADGAI
ncbi:endolytic transglycosylase MltG [Pseudonocardia sp. N23]|uniref:endolytic transglycosylase MltG n=1 Tax=Pseudonocardia sp. N23 TaxID=1987376 RepID=UPI000C030EBB|nr:endolytic transglycosylase MltG [Pseudonocardia sp. N23]GAY11717.1 protein YceG like [Pseudonocardia sp. N23]